MIAQPSCNTAKITIYTNQPKEISPDLFGIFFEDLNYAADGGLYAELIQNRSFEYSSADHPDWNFLTGWEILQSSGKCSISLETEAPIHPNNPHYLVLNAQAANGGIGLRNRGFDGIPLMSGENYNVSLFARALTGSIGPLIVRLESRTGMVLGEATLAEPVSEWMKYTTTIQSKASDRYARFVLLFFGSGCLAVDMISLFPKKTFRNRSNGLREELGQVIADLKP